MLVVGWAAGSGLSNEVRSGTASVFLSKPMSRAAYFWAKFAGLMIVVAVFTVCASAATLLAERVSEHVPMVVMEHAHVVLIDWQTGILFMLAPFAALLVAAGLNYRLRKPFELTAYGLVTLFLLLVFVLSGFFDRSGAWAPFDFRVEWRILPASLLISCALAVFGAMALSLSTRLRVIPTMTICVMMLFAGLLSEYAFGRFADENRLSALAYALIPNWQHFWMADALLAGGSVAPAYTLHAAAYAGLYSLAVLVLGMLSFSSVDLN